jgi:hypothetical protein
MRRTLFRTVVLPVLAGFLGMLLAQALALLTLGDVRTRGVAASDQTSFVSVPDTVSPPWQAYLQTLTDPALTLLWRDQTGARCAPRAAAQVGTGMRV